MLNKHTQKRHSFTLYDYSIDTQKTFFCSKDLTLITEKNIDIGMSSILSTAPTSNQAGIFKKASRLSPWPKLENEKVIRTLFFLFNRTITFFL